MMMKHEMCCCCKECFNVLYSNLAACCGGMGVIFYLVPRNYSPFIEVGDLKCFWRRNCLHI